MLEGTPLGEDDKEVIATPPTPRNPKMNLTESLSLLSVLEQDCEDDWCAIEAISTSVSTNISSASVSLLAAP